MTQLKVLKRLKEFRKLGIQKDIQLEVSRFILIIYTKFIKKLSIAQAIGHRS